MFLATREVMSVFRPGDHGSTFGGNPLAASIGLEALNILVEEDLVRRSAENGDWFLAELRKIDSPLIKEVRGRGLFIGVDIDPRKAAAREVCERLMARGLLSKETHETVVRLAPPLAVDRDSLRWAADQLRTVLEEMDATRKAS
jgi:ornithine--oxo-acid transaminase